MPQREEWHHWNLEVAKCLKCLSEKFTSLVPVYHQSRFALPSGSSKYQPKRSAPKIEGLQTLRG